MKTKPDPFFQIAIFMVSLFAIQIVNSLTGMWLLRFGIIPRTTIGLRGIVFAPLLHVGWGHLMANAAPLAVLLGLLAFGSRQSFWMTTGMIWVLSGLGTWLLGRPGSVQIGASGLIYGLAAFLVVAAWQSRDLRLALIAFLVIFFYGGIVWGLLPTQRGVSWEGHVCGLIAGVMVAKLAKGG